MMNPPRRVSQLNPLLPTNRCIPIARNDPSAPLPGLPASCPSPGLPSGCLHLTQRLNGGLTPKLTPVPVLGGFGTF